ncbi:MAG TPA: prepilin-type N-terminal cleavage/methylation domain-containing protein [Desulforhopalus sp.]|nr:prepilin-type N-terminal cleavage/methylation domain-containing protein [Desulforhopalus sp.]
MAGNRHSRGQRGFTLVEVLIAVVVFAVVIGAVYGSHQATFRVVHGSLRQLADGVGGRAALERLGEDLQALVPGPAGYLRGEEESLAGGRAHRIAFVSTAHLPLRRDDFPYGNSLIEYWLEIDEKSGLQNLYRRASALLPGEGSSTLSAGKSYLLCSGLREFRLSYSDAQGGSHDNWQSRAGDIAEAEDAGREPALLPRLITIELHFPDQRQAEGSLVLTTAVAPLPAVLPGLGGEG